MSDSAPGVSAIERPLFWGPVARGLTWGDGNDLVLLLHEPGADLDAWGHLPAFLARQLEVTVASFDLPGHGLSDDPWRPELSSELLETLLADSSGLRLVVAARSIATAALAHANDLRLSGVVCLSPEPLVTNALIHSPRVPKLILAGARAGDDLDVARQLATTCGGWAVVTALPVPRRGTELLAPAWAERVAEEIAAFVGDCLRRALTPLRRQPRGTGPVEPGEGERVLSESAPLAHCDGQGAGSEGP